MEHRSIYFRKQLSVSQIALGHQIELILHTDITIKNVIVILLSYLHGTEKLLKFYLTYLFLV